MIKIDSYAGRTDWRHVCVRRIKLTPLAQRKQKLCWGGPAASLQPGCSQALLVKGANPHASLGPHTRFLSFFSFSFSSSCYRAGPRRLTVSIIYRPSLASPTPLPPSPAHAPALAPAHASTHTPAPVTLRHAHSATRVITRQSKHRLLHLRNHGRVTRKEHDSRRLPRRCETLGKLLRIPRQTTTAAVVVKRRKTSVMWNAWGGFPYVAKQTPVHPLLQVKISATVTLRLRKTRGVHVAIPEAAVAAFGEALRRPRGAMPVAVSRPRRSNPPPHSSLLAYVTHGHDFTLTPCIHKRLRVQKQKTSLAFLITRTVAL
ncbi:hypothetical protein E2C01_053887 [Portunus trituberculatus]|uniref:Uncharacterized protein n=1 Tax=Portunus trituberculatus TaxID=210409 RepID=A0A5B7GQE1_PORTR|nr:hypothetical protein [Portunus trituberculatus]